MIEEWFGESDVPLKRHDKCDAAGTDAEHAPNYSEDAKVMHILGDDLLRQIGLQVHLGKHAR